MKNLNKLKRNPSNMELGNLYKVNPDVINEISIKEQNKLDMQILSIATTNESNLIIKNDCPELCCLLKLNAFENIDN